MGRGRRQGECGRRDMEHECVCVEVYNDDSSQGPQTDDQRLDEGCGGKGGGGKERM